uniref:Uncharacterized protein n=1 Tax=Tanacetum cinerariifolium TaxID=118510 RepID=A0A6L2MX42_TANCI|nr:hypothetical protein [Tanacetum cinerariifolium]
MESKNDTTVTAVDVLMKNETIVDDVQMENTSNQDNEKAVDNAVSNHRKTVDNVVSNLFQPEPHTMMEKSNLPEKSKFQKNQNCGKKRSTIETTTLL